MDAEIKIIMDFQKAYPTKAAKEKALKSMTNEEIDRLINACPNIYAMIFYASFKKQ